MFVVVIPTIGFAHGETLTTFLVILVVDAQFYYQNYWRVLR